MNMVQKLSGPHLMLSHVGDVDGVFPAHLADRMHNLVRTEFFFTVFGMVVVALPFFDRFDPFGTVSYTHLYVYKRQSQFGALATALASTVGTGNIVGVGTAIAMGAVSYTHLDVYKRQGQGYRFCNTEMKHHESFYCKNKGFLR